MSQNIFLQEVNELGRRLEDRLGSTDFLLPSFADLCSSELKATPLFRLFDFDEFAEVLPSLELPPQYPSNFGQPSITLYRDTKSRFRVDFYIWQNIDTPLHDHAFFGGGQVLLGNSLETKFAFQRQADITPNLSTGQLTPINSKLLKPGDLFPILASQEYIHQVHHLSSPTISLIARLKNDSPEVTQRIYLWPGLSLKLPTMVLGLGEDGKRKNDFQGLLQQLGHPGLTRYTRSLFANSSPDLVCTNFDRFLASTPNLNQLNDMIGFLKTKFGNWVEMLGRYALPRLAKAQLLPDSVSEPNDKLVLDLLHVWGFGPKMESLVAEFNPGTPAREVIIGRMERMTRNRKLNSKWLNGFIDLYRNKGTITREALIRKHELTDWDERLIEGFNLDYLLAESKPEITPPHYSDGLSSGPVQIESRL